MPTRSPRQEPSENLSYSFPSTSTSSSALSSLSTTSTSRRALIEPPHSTSTDTLNRKRGAVPSPIQTYRAPLNDTKFIPPTASSSSSSSSSWNYTGLSSGLPRYASAAAGLSSLSAPPPLQQTPLGARYPQSQPSDDRERTPSFVEYSPVMDRSHLIGLGELATPRWTNDGLERRWAGTETQLQTSYEDVGLDPDMMSQQRPFANARQLSMNSIDSASSPVFQPSTLFAPDPAAHSNTAFPPSNSFHDFALGPAALSGTLSPAFSLDAISVEMEEGEDHIESSWRQNQIEVNSPPQPRVPVNNVELDRDQSLSTMIESHTAPRERVSSDSTAGSLSRRSSGGRSASTEGKVIKGVLHHRRQSASKSGFAHLPPSPATVSVGRSADSSFSNPPPTLSNSTSSTSITLASTSSPHHSTHHPLSRTPDHKQRQLPTHSSSTRPASGNHASPSVIAASILRQTRDLESEGVDASGDLTTADALRKLDGYGSATSPRVAKGMTSSPSTRSRVANTMSSEGDGIPKRRKSSGGLNGIASKDNHDQSFITELFASLSVKDVDSNSPRDREISSPSSPLLSGQTTATPRPPSTTATSDPGYPTSTPSQRASSSFMTVATSTSTTGSRDSNSVTSMSGSSINASAVRSKTGRGSAGSDVSSLNSTGDVVAFSPRTTVVRADSRSETELFVPPPVPPIPKDYEAFRSATSATLINPPRPNDIRRPSESSFTETGLLSPSIRSAGGSEREGSIGKGSNSGSISPKLAPRKWSLSSAFGKSKSAKLASSQHGVQESASYSDLSTIASQRPRIASMNSRLSDKRMAASTNDIASLSNSSSPVVGSSSIHSVLAKSKLQNDTRASSGSGSSNGTVDTIVNPPPPSLIATSPGRSRSSILSPRRTPSSGIPFFSRKTTPSQSDVSSSSSPAVTPQLRKVTSTSSSSEGRKSILGLGFLRSNTIKKEKEKEKVILSSGGTKRMSGSMSMASGMVKAGETGMDEFGRRVNGDGSPKTVVRRETIGLSPSASLSSISSRTNTNSKPVRSTRQDAIKGGLPTIAGSPSKAGRLVVPSPTLNEEQRDNAPTPTRIPRPFPKVAPTVGNATTLSSSASFSTPSFAPPRVNRRLSYLGSTPDRPRLTSSASTSTIQTIDMQDLRVATIVREPGLALGEKTLSTRRRQDSAGGDLSQIPRSRSNVTGGVLGYTRGASREPSEVPLSESVSMSASKGGLRRSTGRETLSTFDEAQSITPRSITSGQLRSSASNVRLSTGPSTADVTATVSLSSARRLLSKSTDGQSSTNRRSSALSAPPPLEAPISALKSSRSMAGGISKMAIPTSRVPRSIVVPSPSALSDSTRSGSSASQYASVSEEEMRGDEEMSAYVRRQQTKKLAAGVSSELIRKMFEFPEPTAALPALSNRDALSLYSRYLTEYEREEIREHEKIYFVGPECNKKPASKDLSTNNHGYDDERGDYLLVPHDHILYRYEVIDVLGKGSFGQVLQCRDHCTGEMVAIKIIRNKKRFHHQALVEIKVLENLVKWDPEERHYVIRMVDSFTFRGHLCIVTELLSINLYELIKANSFVGFSTTLIRRFTVQILGSLSLLRHHRVVHCDLKPENILLKHPAKSAIKVIDFGSSCFEHEKVYTYIQSRFYRSPEIILGMNYHMAIDMWSLGCILAEMFTGFPIFPGENEQEQLACIMEVLGVPDRHLIDKSSRRKLFFDSTGAPRPVVNSKGRRRRPSSKTLAQVLKSDDELFIDFITKCLTWDPDRRLKPDPAMRHPWIIAARSRSHNNNPAPAIPSRVGRNNPTSSTLRTNVSSTTISSSPSFISAPIRRAPPTTTLYHKDTFVPTTLPRSRTESSIAIPLMCKASKNLPSSSQRYTVRS